jgi:hypothetical protein
MGDSEPGGEFYKILMEIKEDVGATRADISRLLPLEGRVTALEIAIAGKAGAAQVKGTIWKGCWELGKLAAAAICGGFASRKLFQ